MRETTLFPIMTGGYGEANKQLVAIRASGGCFAVVGIPWSLIAPHAAQADVNHGQTLHRLAERGGLAPCEALAVLENRRWRQMPVPEAHAKLAALVFCHHQEREAALTEAAIEAMHGATQSRVE